MNVGIFSGWTSGQIRRLLISCTTAVLTLPLVAAAAIPQLVRNINDAVIPLSSFSRQLGTLGDELIFTARDASGVGLWRTNGTAAGTLLIKHFGPTGDVVTNEPLSFVQIGARGYFIASVQREGFELWSTDGTSAGTAVVTDLSDGGVARAVSIKGALGDRLIFTGRDSTFCQEMYVTNGTAAGTQVLTAFSDPNGGVGRGFIVAGEKFYFDANDDDSLQRQIWVSDGTPGGTRQIINPFSGSGSILDNSASFQRVGNRLLYIDRALLWSVDLATDTIDAVTANGGMPGSGPPRLTTKAPLVALDGFAMFIADGNAPGSLELWRSDGTTAGTFKVGDIHSGPAPFQAREAPVFQRAGNKVVYIADDGTNGPQLWGTDGATTVRLTNATPPNYLPIQVAIPFGTIGEIVYFALADPSGSDTRSIWRTDGTAAGTRKITGLPPIEETGYIPASVTGDATDVFFVLRGSLWKYEPAVERVTLVREGVAAGLLYFYDGQRLYFSHDEGMTGAEPWVSDGTPAGTRLLLEIRPQTEADNGSGPNELVDFDGRLVFAADDGVRGRELWISDGTFDGTTLLADINPGAGSSNPNHLIAANGALYFFAVDSSGLSRFMRLSSAAAQPEALAVAAPQPESVFGLLCDSDMPATLGGRVYFMAAPGSNSSEFHLWSSDGTASGTRPVTDQAIQPCHLTAHNNRLYFSAYGASASGDRELWTSDGTHAGTTRVADLVPGPSSGHPRGLIAFNGELYFTALLAGAGEHLWKSDGTAAGTVRVADIAQDSNQKVHIRGVLDGKLLLEVATADFPTQGISHPRQLWTSGGAISDTSRMFDFQTDGSADLLVTSSRAYFAARDSSGFEPWVSDGTAAGTRLLRDINPTGNSNPAWFADFRGVTVFATNDPIQGSQLWRTNGASTGTVLIGNVPASPPLRNPCCEPRRSIVRQRLTIGQKFFFVANDSETGQELYVLTNDAPVAVADSATSAGGAAVTVHVIANDVDSDGMLAPQSVRIVTQPAHGTATSNANGAIDYTPAAGFSGTDTFSYTVDDNQGARSNAAIVTVTVNATAASSERRGGGGSMNLLEVLALSALLRILSRRRGNT
ncbi:ELWxxDGT repeat protein [Steroidobacter cummioxidans]|uniref:ELWxxDGT repeat protein n=1 Tax=Steroidobacter cummioxidans TaxID=1803913 RepID=UPI000E3172DF|nr:ELWxxDGT repeat protein [Steroidobacter cummioxidans]